ncbi:MAG: response regulator [Magnetococcales bacterium]|nr:response regulator [Magnetococcales bacterium]
MIATQRQTLLIVDDVPGNIKFMMSMLVDHYQVMAANNGQTALKIIATKPPDLILLDVMMPEMDGYQVCRQLQASDATRTIPVIFVTAMDNQEDEGKGFACGAVDYITKPIKPEVLHARIHTHLELRRQREQIAAMQVVLDQVQDSILLMDAEGCILDCNASVRSLLGYSREQLIGQPLEQFVQSPEWPAMKQVLLQRQGHREQLLGSAVCADGRAINVEMGWVAVQRQNGIQLIAFLRELAK